MGTGRPEACLTGGGRSAHWAARHGNSSNDSFVEVARRDVTSGARGNVPAVSPGPESSTYPGGVIGAPLAPIPSSSDPGKDRESFQATLRSGTLGGRIRTVKRSNVTPSSTHESAPLHNTSDTVVRSLLTCENRVTGGGDGVAAHQHQRCSDARRCLRWDSFECPKPAKPGGRSYPRARTGGHRRTRFRTERERPAAPSGPQPDPRRRPGEPSPIRISPISRAAPRRR